MKRRIAKTLALLLTLCMLIPQTVLAATTYYIDVEITGPDAAGAQQGSELIQRFKQKARRQDMERFLDAYPGVKAESIPQEVWGRVAQGVPLVSAYAMYENQQLRVQLAAERQNRANRARTPGGLGANAGVELDEMDRMWAEDD